MRPRAETRRLGLDKPCQDCGDTIYFGYKGPIDGICGKCADKRLRSRAARSKARTVVVHRNGRSRAAGWALIVL
ncbi:MAG: hypothetical protein OER88_01070, partial [Planctomycetota bacterium]|nr:hypothetical protein [Planctomycetota bacterium]